MKKDFIEKNIINLFTLTPLIYILSNTLLDITAILISIFILLKYSNNFRANFVFYFFIVITSLGSIISFNSEYILNYFILFRFILLIIFIYFLIYDENELDKFYLYSFIGLIIVAFVNCLEFFFPETFNIGQKNFSPNGEVVRVAGLFRDELISGSYLSFFIPFGLIFFVQKKIKFIYSIFFILLVFYGTLLSGERSALLSIIIFMGLYLIKKFKDNLILFFILLIITLIIFYFNYYLFKRYTIDLYNSLVLISDSNYIGLFWSSIILSFENIKTILLGNGVESFEYICNQSKDLYVDSIYLCNKHPHNLYLEVLFSFGVFPFIFLLYLYFKTLLNFIKNFRILNEKYYILYISLISFFMPFKTSGSIFSQRFGFIFFIFLSIFLIINFKKIKFSKN